jgi:predicted ester cyclase
MTGAVTDQDNAALVRPYFDQVRNRGDLAAVDDFFGDEFENFGRRGAEARGLVRAIAAAWRRAFPDLRFEVEDEVVSVDPVVHRVTCSGTHTGAFEHRQSVCCRRAGVASASTTCTSIESVMGASSSTGARATTWR